MENTGLGMTKKGQSHVGLFGTSGFLTVPQFTPLQSRMGLLYTEPNRQKDAMQMLVSTIRNLPLLYFICKYSSFCFRRRKLEI